MLFLTIYIMGAVCGMFGAINYFENHTEMTDSFYGYVIACLLAVMFGVVWFAYPFVWVFKQIDRAITPKS